MYFSPLHLILCFPSLAIVFCKKISSPAYLYTGLLEYAEDLLQVDVEAVEEGSLGGQVLDDQRRARLVDVRRQGTGQQRELFHHQDFKILSSKYRPIRIKFHIFFNQ